MNCPACAEKFRWREVWGTGKEKEVVKERNGFCARVEKHNEKCVLMEGGAKVGKRGKRREVRVRDLE